MATIKFFDRTETKNKLANIYVRFKEGRTIDMTAKTGKFTLSEKQ